MSGKQKKNTNTVPNIGNIRKTTDESKSNLDALYTEACTEAFNFIIKDSNEKINEAAAKSRNRAYIYTWEYLEDKSDKTYSFNGIRIMDILTKGGLLEKLKNHYNPDNDKDGFYVAWMKFKKRDENEPSQYGVYVSWYIPKEQREEQRE